MSLDLFVSYLVMVIEDKGMHFHTNRSTLK